MSKYSKIIIFNNNINNISINDIFNNYFIDENYITPNNKLFDTINYYKYILIFLCILFYPHNNKFQIFQVIYH